jgi:hypothetical protein
MQSKLQIIPFRLLTRPLGHPKEGSWSKNFSALKNGKVATPYKSQAGSLISFHYKLKESHCSRHQ